MNLYSKVLICLFFTFLLNSIDSRAQQDLFMSQYMFNNMTFNPAYAGFEGTTNVSLLYHNQWTGYAPSKVNEVGGAPELILASFTSPLYKLRSGIGILLKSETQGPLNKLSSSLSYAYHLQVKEYKLSFGLNVGFISQVLNNDILQPNEDGDQVLNSLGSTSTKPDASLGAFFQSENLYFGISYNHILKSKFDFDGDGLDNQLESDLVFTAGYDYIFNNDITISPSLLFVSNFITTSYNVGTILDYKRKFWGGAVYKNSQALGLIFGVGLLKNNALRVGYAMDYVYKDANAKQSTSHEIQATYSIPINIGEKNKIIRTPRFRHL